MAYYETITGLLIDYWLALPQATLILSIMLMRNKIYLIDYPVKLLRRTPRIFKAFKQRFPLRRPGFKVGHRRTEPRSIRPTHMDNDKVPAAVALDDN
jgi:hypothetical protein